MIKDLSSWVKQVILVVMFASFIDFIIPENRFLKYTKVFLSLIVMMAIISPMIGFLQKDFSLYDTSLVYQDITDKEILSQHISRLDDVNNSVLVQQYKEKVISILQRELRDLTSYEVENLRVDIVEDTRSENFGNIEGIYVLFREKKEEKGTNAKKVLVDKISVIDGEKEYSNIRKREEAENIQRFLISQYKIPEDKIQFGWEE